jgi:parallel beta-helix repeat protein
VGATAKNGESRRVTISRCIVRNNRRQGLSVTGCIGGLVENSEFTDTRGTAPQSGIDLEPNSTLRVTDVTIRNCIADRNAGYGILLCNPTVSAIKISSTQCNDNALDGATLLRGVTLSRIEGCRFERNKNNGVHLIGSSQNEVVSNTFRSNGRADVSRYASVRLVDGSSNNVISANTFVHGPQGNHRTSVVDVTEATADCINNSVTGNLG